MKIRSLLLGAGIALFLVACSAAAVQYVSQEQHEADIEQLREEHEYDVNQLYGVIAELEYRTLNLELMVFDLEGR